MLDASLATIGTISIRLRSGSNMMKSGVVPATRVTGMRSVMRRSARRWVDCISNAGPAAVKPAGRVIVGAVVARVMFHVPALA